VSGSSYWKRWPAKGDREQVTVLRPQPLTRRPTVSVVVPCYNYGHYLADAVDSVLSQQAVDVDVLIIDDASPDGSGEVAEALASSDSRVNAIRHKRNVGHISTYNEGLASVDGDYVVLLSADDMLTPGALARATALLEANPTVAMAYGFPVAFESRPPAARTHVRNWTIWSGAEWIRRSCRRGRNCIMCPEVVMRASVQRSVGLYRHELPHSGDFEMWLRAASVGDVGRVNGPDQAYYRVHGASMQRTVYRGLLTDMRGRRDAFDAVLARDPEDVAAQRLNEIACRSLASEALRHAARTFDHSPAHRELIDEYIAFANETFPAAHQLRSWGALQRRRWLTEQWSQDTWPLAWLSRPRDDLFDRVRWRKWRWSGV
jgi:glycosyltransferase involved in cell wall biosynthesis